MRVPASINSGAAGKVSRDAAAAMAAASPEGRALYQANVREHAQVMNHREEDSSSPDVATVAIVRALTASDPGPST